MGLLTDISVAELAGKLEAISGVRVYDARLDKGTFKLGLTLPDGRKELIARVDVYNDNIYYDVDETPRVTPPAHLLVNEVLAEYDLQPIAATRD